MSAMFLIVHIPEAMRDCKDLRFEIQLIDDFGHTSDSVLVGGEESEVRVGDTVVPLGVLDKARGLDVGESTLVDILGNPTYPGRDPDKRAVQNVFFVVRLRPEERWPEQKEGQSFGVHLVNRFGQTTVDGYFGENDKAVVVGGVEVPRKVLEAAKRQAIGSGEYVNANGEPVMPGSWEPVIA
jgi:hypothetical protein